jgi:hypothetical protein
VEFGHGQHIGFGHFNHSSRKTGLGQRCPKYSKKSENKKLTL